MATEDFDIASLASYLHLTPQQVDRLAGRDKIPARKVAGKWRFSRAEIHHWLEDRIGLADEEELNQVEEMLDSSNQLKTISISRLVPQGGIEIPLAARTRRSVINAMTKVGASTGILWDPERMNEAVHRREEMQSTALDIGVALLHPRRPLPNILSEALIVVGRTSQGIPFGGSRTLTDVFFLICSTSDQSHLRILARLSRLLSLPETLEGLRAAHDEVDARAVIERMEAVIDA